jgi:hypothetical protein
MPWRSAGVGATQGERDHEQMVIALLCSAQGCPVGVEVFAGNTLPKFFLSSHLHGK